MNYDFTKNPQFYTTLGYAFLTFLMSFFAVVYEYHSIFDQFANCDGLCTTAVWVDRMHYPIGMVLFGSYMIVTAPSKPGLEPSYIIAGLLAAIMPFFTGRIVGQLTANTDLQLNLILFVLLGVFTTGIFLVVVYNNSKLDPTVK